MFVENSLRLDCRGWEQGVRRLSMDPNASWPRHVSVTDRIIQLDASYIVFRMDSPALFLALNTEDACYSICIVM
jgi:hypothetical protein